ncbi:MAG: DUF84 family protein [Deltaproteobacteria bacterium]
MGPDTAWLSPDWRDELGYGSALVPRRAALNLPALSPPSSIVVTSEKTLKIDAARQLAVDLFGAELPVDGEKTASGVPEQPVDDEALRGARQRAQGIDAECIVSIENGLFFEIVDAPEAWTEVEAYVGPRGVAVDRAAVVVVLRGTRYEGVGAGVLVPRRFAEAAEASAWTLTAGKAMAAAWDVPHDDWHAALVGVDRAALIRSAWWPREST